MAERDPIATYKDLCIDAVDVHQAARFWGAVLGLKVTGSTNVSLTGPTATHRIWINEVPEERTVKNRVHLDVHTGPLTDLEALGARVLEPQSGGRRWTIMADPDGQEFCAFVRDEVPSYRLYEVCVDCSDPERITRWWADVYGVEAQQEDGYWYHEMPGAPFETVVFAPVPEGKQIKNRVHWDVYADPQALIEAGAMLVRPEGDDLGWTVLSDPDGNEFCAFTPR